MIFKWWESTKKELLRLRAEQYIQDTAVQRMRESENRLLCAELSRLLRKQDLGFTEPESNQYNSIHEQIAHVKQQARDSKASFWIVLSYGKVTFHNGVESFTEIV